jgi:predicted metal-dependent phosphoesterase TrpH
LIDLHSHTNCSDGTDSPGQLLEAAVQAGLRALAITDHDTFDGYVQARALEPASLELVCGVELSTRFDSGKPMHLLAYFLDGLPGAGFLEWLADIQEARRARNERMAERLRELELNATVEEAEALGRSITGRVHFARVLVANGHADSIDDAFDRYLNEEGPAYVAMEEPRVTGAIQQVRAWGGLPVLAHPVRLGVRNPLEEEQLIGGLVDAGLIGIEVYHCDHGATSTSRYLGMARRFGLAVTGGSDYHGSVKPGVKLGSGYRGNVRVPYALLEGLRSRHQNLGAIPQAAS